MVRGVLFVALLALTGFAGWVGGTVYPAPSRLIAMLGPQAVAMRASSDFKFVNAQLQKSVGQNQKLADLGNEAARLASQAGNAIIIEHQSDQSTVDAEKDAAPTPTIAMAPVPSSTGGFETALAVCPEMKISNEPPVDTAGRVEHYKPVVDINGDAIAVEPVSAGCLSSGFGYRSGKLHKGIDFFDRGGGKILAAGDGTIVEMKYRDDYGNMYVIDHGHGVYTRYAHLSAFTPGLKVGSKVHAGEVIGLMGNTAAYPVPVHLHYELLLGDYNNPKGSFGLKPTDIFDYLKTS